MLELLSPHPLGSPLPLPGDNASPEHNNNGRPSTKLQGDNVHAINDVEAIAKKTPDDRTMAVQEGSENRGASKVNPRTAAVGVVDGGRNSHDEGSLSSGCLLGGNRPLITGAGLSDGVESPASAGRGIQSPADAAG